jgi:hypothetical protein
MDTKRQNVTGVKGRIDRALDSVQKAQTHLGRALEELSPIIGALPEYEAGQKVWDDVHSYWYRVRALLDRIEELKLDHERSANEIVRDDFPER